MKRSNKSTLNISPSLKRKFKQYSPLHNYNRIDHLKAWAEVDRRNRVRRMMEESNDGVPDFVERRLFQRLSMLPPRAIRGTIPVPLRKPMLEVTPKTPHADIASVTTTIQDGHKDGEGPNFAKMPTSSAIGVTPAAVKGVKVLKSTIVPPSSIMENHSRLIKRGMNAEANVRRLVELGSKALLEENFPEEEDLVKEGPPENFPEEEDLVEEEPPQKNPPEEPPEEPPRKKSFAKNRSRRAKELEALSTMVQKLQGQNVGVSQQGMRRDYSKIPPPPHHENQPRVVTITSTGRASIPPDRFNPSRR